LHTASVDHRAPGPGVSILGQTFMFLDRVGKGKDDWLRVGARHRLDDLSREQFSNGADADEGCRLEVLDSGDDLWGLARQVEMIEGLAGRQLVRVGQLDCGKA